MLNPEKELCVVEGTCALGFSDGSALPGFSSLQQVIQISGKFVSWDGHIQSYASHGAKPRPNTVVSEHCNKSFGHRSGSPTP